MAYIGKSPSTGIRNRFIYTATAGQTSFSGSDDHSRTLSYTDAEFMDVFLNGVKLDKSDYTATSGTSVVLDEGAAVDDILEVVAYDTFSVFNGEFSADVTVGGTLTASGNVDVTGDLTVDTDTLYVDSADNRVGVGTVSPSAALDIAYGDYQNSGAIRVGADLGTNTSRTDDTRKFAAITIPHFDNAEEDMVILTSDSYSASGGSLTLGGGSDSFNAPNLIGFQTSSDGASAGTERMRIDSSGKVGIGNSSPTHKLDILDNNSGNVITRIKNSNAGTGARAGIFLDNDDTNVMALYATSSNYTGVSSWTDAGVISTSSAASGGLIFNSQSSGIKFQTGTTERMRINNTGSVSIAASSGNGYLSVQQAYNGTTGSAANMHILSNGNFLRSTSSGRYKTGVEDAEMSYAEELYNLRPVYYKSLGTFDNPNHGHWGFIAEEVAEIDPRLCLFKTTELDLDDDGNVQYDDNGNVVETTLDEPVVEGVQYDRIIPLLLMLLKAEKDKVETLETKVAALETAKADFETRIAALEAN